MGKVIPFSEIESYLASIEKSDAQKGAILDTNVLISASYDIRDSHSEVVDIWALLQQKNYRLFATVNTRSEYLEFQRRLILTERLLDLVDEFHKASKLFFAVSLDFDIGYATLSDPDMKDVVVPDRLFREFKHYHFPN